MLKQSIASESKQKMMECTQTGILSQEINLRRKTTRLPKVYIYRAMAVDLTNKATVARLGSVV